MTSKRKTSPTVLRVLKAAASRERGNVIPMSGLNGGSQRVVLKAMERLGFVEYDGIYRITPRGREVVGERSAGVLPEINWGQS